MTSPIDIVLRAGRITMWTAVDGMPDSQQVCHDVERRLVGSVDPDRNNTGKDVSNVVSWGIDQDCEVSYHIRQIVDGEIGDPVVLAVPSPARAPNFLEITGYRTSRIKNTRQVVLRELDSNGKTRYTVKMSHLEAQAICDKIDLKTAKTHS